MPTTLRANSLLPTSLTLVVEPSPIRGLDADYPLLQYLGFNLILSIYFFLLSQPSRLVIFHTYVVVYIALGNSSNSVGKFIYTLLCTDTRISEYLRQLRQW